MAVAFVALEWQAHAEEPTDIIAVISKAEIAAPGDHLMVVIALYGPRQHRGPSLRYRDYRSPDQYLYEGIVEKEEYDRLFELLILSEQDDVFENENMHIGIRVTSGIDENTKVIKVLRISFEDFGRPGHRSEIFRMLQRICFSAEDLKK